MYCSSVVYMMMIINHSVKCASNISVTGIIDIDILNNDRNVYLKKAGMR